MKSSFARSENVGQASCLSHHRIKIENLYDRQDACSTFSELTARHRTPKTHSRQNAIDQLAVNIRQAKIAALEAVGEFLVIDPKAVHHRSIEVMDVHRILGHVIAIVVGGPVTESAFHAAARQPNRIATAMMIATVI